MKHPRFYLNLTMNAFQSVSFNALNTSGCSSIGKRAPGICVKFTASLVRVKVCVGNILREQNRTTKIN